MPKTRLQKEEILATTIDRLSRSQSVVFVTVQGVKVSEMEGLRDGLFKEQLQLQVAKNSLFKRALQETGMEVPAELLDQPVGMVFGYDDVVAAPKAVMPFAKEIEALKVVGGIMEKKFISVAEVESLATLPSRDQLLSRLVGSLSSPLSGMVNVLQGNIRGLVTVLGQIRDARA